MSIRCIPSTSENINFINSILEHFPSETFNTIKSLINSWMSNNLSDSEDRFPTLKELEEWRRKVRVYNENSYYNQNDGKNVFRDERLLKLESNPSIEEILNIVSYSEYSSIAELFQKYKELFKNIQFKTNSKYNFTKSEFEGFQGRRAYYDASNKTIYINVLSSFEKGNSSSVLLHELIHSITVDRVLNNSRARNKFEKILDDYQRVSYDRRYVKSPISEIDHSLEEFIANIWSDAKTIETLKNIKSTRVDKSLWEEIKDFFTDLFSGIFKGTTSDSLMAEASVELIKLLEEPITITVQSKGKFRENIDIKNIEKSYQSFNPIERKNIINKISRMFSNIVGERLERRKEELNRQIDQTNNFIRKRELIDEVKNLSRFTIIKRDTPVSIFREIEETFRIYAEASLDDRYEVELEIINNDPNSNSLKEEVKKKAALNKAKRKGEIYIRILDNFKELAEESTSNFALTEGVSMDISNDYIDRDFNTDNIDESGSTQDSFAENKEEVYKDGWMTNVREVSSYSSLSNEVRRAISNIARVNKYGLQEKDAFGDTTYLEPSYVHSELIQALRNMVSAEDMIPMLETLATKKVWAKQIVSEIKDNPRLFTLFYRAYRKDYLNYWIQKRKQLADGSFKTQTISINKSEGTAHYFDEWRDNYEFGNILAEDSLYNKNGDIQLENANIGLELVNNILSKFPREVSREEEIAITNDEDTINKLNKALGMLGISIDTNTLTNSLNYRIEDVRFPISLRQVLDNLRTIYYDLNKGNGKVENGKPADLINIYGSAFNSIAEVFNFVDEDVVESNVRQGDKNRYAHVNPSYLTTLIKKFKREDVQDFINREYKAVNWFYDSKLGWKNEWLKDLEGSKESREKLDHIVLLEYNKKEYVNWSNLDATLVLINQYFSSPTKNEEGYAYYQVPMLSDSQSAEFIRGKRYIDNYESILLDKFINLVKQELERISLVNKRYNNDADAIANFDRVKKKDDTITIGGAEFKFFPELNRNLYGSNSDRSFLDVYNEMLRNSSTQEELNNFIKESVNSIMEQRFFEAMQEYENIGLLDRVSNDKNAKYLYFNKYSESGVSKMLKEYYWNSTYAQSQIIQLLTTDLAYYKDLEDFQKRNKQVHAPAERLNTLATWNVNGIEQSVLQKVPLKDAKGNNVLDKDNNIIMVPRKERTIYLKDYEKTSISLEDIEEVVNAKIAKGELTSYDKAVILGAYKKVNVADAQAYRSLSSFRATQIMAGMWSEEEETAYNNFKNNTWSARDFTVLWNVRKPYLYTQTNQSNQVDDGLIRVSTQNKNSELLLLTQALFGQIMASGKMRAISDFMESEQIDVVQFESTVKDGKQGIIDLNDLEDNDYNGVISRLRETTSNTNVIHEFDYNDYGIQTATPEHGIDAVQLVGTQIRRLIGADMDKDAVFEYGGRKWNRDQWFNYFNAINVANIRTAFESLDKKFKDNKEIEKELLREVRSNPRYGNDLIKALSLNKEGEFNIPLNDPAQTLRIQALLNSILKSKVTKQKIQGGALIQASAYGLNRKPKLVFEGEGENKRLKYMECYIPCPTEELYNLLLDPNTHEIDINKKDETDNYIVPRKYLECIGYRVPTEDKYSMAPLKVIGFLPRQVGSVIILPEEITAIAGSDFDVDKMYTMFHTIKVDEYDYTRAKKDFESANKGISSLIDDLLGLEESVEDSEVFKEWFNENKESYRYKTPKVRVVSFNYDNNVSPDDKSSIYKMAKSQTKEQRDSLIIDMMWSVLTNKDTVGKIINPGGFNEPKRVARLLSVANSITLDEFNSTFNKDFTKKSLKELENLAKKYKKELNPLTPNTWVTLHNRNMSGAQLIGIAANHNAGHALMQRTNLGVSKDYILTFNGNKYDSLHSIKTPNGKFITRNVSGFLAAFVDNAKDPIAGDMNFNTTTANAAFTLLRLGVEPMTVGLLLSQPIVKDIVTKVMNERISIQEAINKVLYDYKNLSAAENISNIPSKNKINEYNFTDEELLTNILASKNAGLHSNNIEEATFYSNQVKVGYLFAKLNKLSSDLGDLTQATRADTQNGAAGPSIADDVIKIEKVKDVLDKSKTDGYSLTGVDFILEGASEEDIINSPLPILQAFYTYGIESTEDLFGRLFPQYNESYREIIKYLKSETKYGRLSVKTRNSIYNDIISYYLTQFSNFGGDSNVTKKIKDPNTGEEIEVVMSNRDYYINEFPKEFKKFKEEHKELQWLSLINRLKTIGNTKYNPVSSIIFTNVGKVTDIQKEQYIREWTNMLYMGGEITEMARKLFIYNCYKGFGFSPSGFSHLASSVIKMDNGQYINGLKGVNRPFDWKNFGNMYILNHLDNRELVPDVSRSSVEINSDTNEFEVSINLNSPYEDKQFAHPFDDNDKIIYHSFIHFNIKGRDVYFQRQTEEFKSPAVYHKVKPLGLKNQYVEYQYGVSAETMESVIPEATNNEMSWNDIYDDGSTIDYSNMDDNSGAYVSFSEADLSGITSLPTLEIDEALVKLASMTPNNTDAFTGENYCGTYL